VYILLYSTTGILSSDGIDHVLWALPRMMTLNIYCTLKPDSIKIKNALSTGIKTVVVGLYGPSYEGMRKLQYASILYEENASRGP